MNEFPIIIVCLFVFAAIVEGIGGNVGKMWFYILSALINLNVMWLKG